MQRPLRWAHTGKAFEWITRKQRFYAAKQRLQDPIYRLKKQWAEVHNLYPGHPAIDKLSKADLLDWEMELIVEQAAEEFEGSFASLEFKHVFKEEDPNDFDTIFDELLEAAKLGAENTAEIDLNTVFDEAKALYFERTGIEL